MSDSKNLKRVFDENVVMFPSSKRFEVTPDSKELLDDPLEDLLTEFDGHEFSDFDEELEAELEEIAQEELAKIRGQKIIHNLGQMKQDELIDTVSMQLKSLQEVQNRISYFLKEIDSYMPSRS